MRVIVINAMKPAAVVSVVVVMTTVVTAALPTPQRSGKRVPTVKAVKAATVVPAKSVSRARSVKPVAKCVNSAWNVNLARLVSRVRNANPAHRALLVNPELRVNLAPKWSLKR